MEYGKRRIRCGGTGRKPMKQFWRVCLSAALLLLALTAAAAALSSCKKHEHVWGKWEIVKGETCQEEGQRAHTCTVCGETATEVIPVGAHQFAEWTTVRPATCEEDGEDEQVCTVCGYRETRTTAHFGEHIWGEYKIGTDVTCQTGGTVQRVCTRCLKVEAFQVAPSGNHTYGHWEISQQPTCKASGTRVRYCLYCGHEQTETVSPDPDVHTYGEWKTVTPATCSDTGRQERVCVDCGAVDSGVLPVLNTHQWGEVVRVVQEADCTHVGISFRICDTCGNLGFVSEPAKGHTYGTNPYEHDTKTHWRTCTVCGETDGPTAHDWTKEEVIREATCEMPGESRFVCGTCGAVDVHQTIVPHTPDETKGWLYMERLNDSELIHYQVCAVCGLTFNEGTHTFGSASDACTTCGFKPTKVDQIFRFDLKTDGTYRIIGLRLPMKNVEIPSLYNGLPVTEIADFAFTGTGIESVSFRNADRLTRIGLMAFANCTALGPNLALPITLTELGSSAFSGCTALRAVTSLGAIEEIGMSTFEGCGALAQVNLPETLTKIGASAFKGCGVLESIVLPAALREIGANAFQACVRLTSVTFLDTGFWFVKNTSTAYEDYDATDAAENARFLIGKRSNLVKGLS